MEDDFSFSYKLSGLGWARISVSNGTQSVQMRASYLSDALGDMIESIVAVLDGTSRVWWDWQDEPGEHLWCLERYGLEGVEDSVRIQIFSDAAISTWEGLGAAERQARFAHSDVKVEADGTVVERVVDGPLVLVMLLTLEWKQFLTMVLVAADELLAEHGGVEGYANVWASEDMPYPRAGVERIRQVLERLG